jgi:nitrogen fixation/metabolism regulation signal transduction histidine kinase
MVNSTSISSSTSSGSISFPVKTVFIITTTVQAFIIVVLILVIIRRFYKMQAEIRLEVRKARRLRTALERRDLRTLVQ